jgi:hypothetical protein
LDKCLCVHWNLMKCCEIYLAVGNLMCYIIVKFRECQNDDGNRN